MTTNSTVGDFFYDSIKRAIAKLNARIEYFFVGTWCEKITFWLNYLFLQNKLLRSFSGCFFCFFIWVLFQKRRHYKKNEVSIKDFFSKCDQIHRNLRIWLHLLKKFLMEKFIFCAVRRCTRHQGKEGNHLYLSQSI